MKINCPNCGVENLAENHECSTCYSNLERVAKVNSETKEKEKNKVVDRECVMSVRQKASHPAPPQIHKNETRLFSNLSSKKDGQFDATISQQLSKDNSLRKSCLNSSESTASSKKLKGLEELNGKEICQKNSSFKTKSIFKGLDKLWLNKPQQTKLSQWLQGLILSSQQPRKFSSSSEKCRRWIKYITIATASSIGVIWVSSTIINNNGIYRSSFKSELEVPQGLFDYGGAPFFASLIDEGLNIEIENSYPKFDLRYAKPLSDFSVSNAIKQLINGELSFVYNDRPLSEEEYEMASKRGFKVLQTPIALDAIAVYGNAKIPVNNLGMDLVIKIFKGEITNWKQIDGKTDLLIVPIVLEKEDYNLPEYNENSDNIVKVKNYTQAVREVIKNPGAISLASSALVKDQQLVKTFSLAQPYTKSYFNPFIENEDGKSIDFLSVKENYPFTRKLYIAIRQDNTLQEQAGKVYTEYLTSKVGQKFIKSTGFVPIYY